MRTRLITICVVMALAVLGAWVISAQAQSGKATPSTAPAAINNQAAVSCNLCFTCGGDWPVFSGAWNSTGSQTERGSGCSGGLILRADTRPFLCCN
jgi:hypothetical protein